MAEPSRIDQGRPVSGSFRITTAVARWSPRWMFAGAEATHLTPATWMPSPRWAGRAMMRLAGWSGHRKKVECGSDVCPRACMA